MFLNAKAPHKDFMINIKKKMRALTPLLFVFCALHAFAADTDHPLLSGMPDYKVDSRKVTAFGVYERGDEFFCTDTRKCDTSDPGFNADGKLVPEGKVTALHYSSNSGTGQPLAVFRNYEAAIRQLGGRKLTNRTHYEGNFVFLVEKEAQRTWIVLENGSGCCYKLTFIEEKPMQQVVKAGQLTTSKQLEDAINNQGFATIYINFDNNSAVIQPQAKPAVAEIAALLSKDKSLRLSIEGHTDNVGNAATNKTLSEARANSVMKMLVQSQIDGKRLQAKGFGSEVPVADNRSDEGRAKNRRVELVKLK